MAADAGQVMLSLRGLKVSIASVFVARFIQSE